MSEKKNPQAAAPAAQNHVDPTLPRRSNKELFAEYDTYTNEVASAKKKQSDAVKAILDANEGKKAYSVKGKKLTIVERTDESGAKVYSFKQPSAKDVVSV